MFQVLGVLYIKVCKIEPLDLYFLLFPLAFISADHHITIFHKFLKLHSALSEKKDFHQEFPFFNGFNETVKSPHLLNGQNPLKV